MGRGGKRWAGVDGEASLRSHASHLSITQGGLNVIRNFKNTQNLSEHLGNDSQSLGHNAGPRLTRKRERNAKFSNARQEQYILLRGAQKLGLVRNKPARRCEIRANAIAVRTSGRIPAGLLRRLDILVTGRARGIRGTSVREWRRQRQRE